MVIFALAALAVKFINFFCLTKFWILIIRTFAYIFLIIKWFVCYPPFAFTWLETCNFTYLTFALKNSTTSHHHILPSLPCLFSHPYANQPFVSRPESLPFRSIGALLFRIRKRHPDRPPVTPCLVSHGSWPRGAINYRKIGRGAVCKAFRFMCVCVCDFLWRADGRSQEGVEGRNGSFGRWRTVGIIYGVFCVCKTNHCARCCWV